MGLKRTHGVKAYLEALAQLEVACAAGFRRDDLVVRLGSRVAADEDGAAGIRGNDALTDENGPYADLGVGRQCKQETHAQKNGLHVICSQVDLASALLSRGLRHDAQTGVSKAYAGVASDHRFEPRGRRGNVISALRSMRRAYARRSGNLHQRREALGCR